jgi:hypothetical protein
MKKSNDTIGNRTRDLPACSAVPQPTEPPHAPLFSIVLQILKLFFYKVNVYIYILVFKTLCVIHCLVFRQNYTDITKQWKYF